MRGNDCNVTPEWWESDLAPMQAANLSHAHGIVRHHTGHECVRLRAARDYIDNQAADVPQRGWLHRADGSVDAVYADGLVLPAVPADDK